MAAPCKNCGGVVKLDLPEFGDPLTDELKADTQMIEQFKRWLWTTEPPTVEGWYWVYGKEFDYKNRPLLIYYNKHALSDKVRALSGAYAYNRLKYVTHWLGPLPVPEPPQ